MGWGFLGGVLSHACMHSREGLLIDRKRKVMTMMMMVLGAMMVDWLVISILDE